MNVLRHTAAPPHRILVLANETLASDALHEALWFLASGRRTEVLVVAPAGAGPDDARVRACLARLEAAGLDAQGWVGDADPLQAIEDVLAVHEIDELVVVTHPAGRSALLAADVLDRARAVYDGPILHIVEDPARTRLAA